MNSTELTLRPATEADLDWICDLRNEPVTVRFSKSGVRTREDLEQDYLHSASKSVYVVLQSDGPDVGFVILAEEDAGTYEIGIAIVPELRGQGLARPMIQRGSQHAAKFHGARRVLATIVPGNAASRRSFRACGYALDVAASTPVLEHHIWVPPELD